MGRYTPKYKNKFSRIVMKETKSTDRRSNSSETSANSDSSKESMEILWTTPSVSHGSSDTSNDPYLDVKLCDFRSQKIKSVLQGAKHIRHFLDVDLTMFSDSGNSESSSDDTAPNSREALFPGLPPLPGPVPNPPPPTPISPINSTVRSCFQRNKKKALVRVKEMKPLLDTRKTTKEGIDASKTIKTLIQDLNNNSHEVITRVREKPRDPTNQAKTFPAQCSLPVNTFSRAESRFKSSATRLEKGASITQLIDQLKSQRALAGKPANPRSTKSWIEMRDQVLNRDVNARPARAKPAAGRPEAHVVNVPYPRPRCTLNTPPVVIALAGASDPPLDKDKRPADAERRAGGTGFLPPIVDRWQANTRRAVPSLVDRLASGDGLRARPDHTHAYAHALALDVAHGRASSVAPRNSASRLPPIKMARWERGPPDATARPPPPPRPGPAPAPAPGAATATPRLPPLPGAAPRAPPRARPAAPPPPRQPPLLAINKILFC